MTLKNVGMMTNSWRDKKDILNSRSSPKKKDPQLERGEGTLGEMVIIMRDQTLSTLNP